MNAKKFTGTIRCDVPVCIVIGVRQTTAELVEPRGEDGEQDAEVLRAAKQQAGDQQEWPAWSSAGERDGFKIQTLRQQAEAIEERKGGGGRIEQNIGVL